MSGTITENTARFDAIANDINKNDIISRDQILQSLRDIGTNRRINIERRLISAGWRFYVGKIRAVKAYAIFMLSPSCTLEAAKAYCKQYHVRAEDLQSYTGGEQICTLTNGQRTGRCYETFKAQGAKRDWSAIQKKGDCKRQTAQDINDCVDILLGKHIITRADMDLAMKTAKVDGAGRETVKSRRSIITNRLAQGGFKTWKVRKDSAGHNVHFLWAHDSVSAPEFEAYCHDNGFCVDTLKRYDAKQPQTSVCSTAASRGAEACAELMAAIFRYRDYCRAQQ